MLTRRKVQMWVVAFAAVPVLAQDREGTIYLPPPESSEARVVQLSEDLAPARNLTEILGKGNEELAIAIEEHKKHKTYGPSGTEGKVMRLVAELFGKVLGELESLKANEGRIRDGLKGILRTAEKAERSVGSRMKELKEFDEKAAYDAELLDRELIDLAKTIRSNPDNDEELRRDFGYKLRRALRLSRQHNAFRAHLSLNAKFAEQVAHVTTAFRHLQDNLDMLLADLDQHRILLLNHVELFQTAAELSGWLREQGDGYNSAVAIANKLAGLENGFVQIYSVANRITDLNDVTDLLHEMPVLDSLSGADQQEMHRIEENYIDYYSRKGR